ncbi:nitroreductase [Acuticoccus sp.]|uniref:nitroreductase n=1 Tax=Acuticoccus sp. TaxID=1904378 RepID=UPI003B517500
MREAVARRRSVRAFLDRPVPGEVIRRVLTEAARAPSGGNLQPWHIDVVADEALDRFRAIVAQKMEETPRGEAERDYDVYPKALTAPYTDRRFAVGESLYAVLGVAREDKQGRLKWYKRNAELFGAPMALFCFVDRQMGPPQWSDLGMFLQNVMLLCEAEGLATCAQEYWASWPRTVAGFLGTPDNRMLFTGMAIGWPDPDHAINRHDAGRVDLADFVAFHGV